MSKRGASKEERFTREELDWIMHNKIENDKCPYCGQETFGIDAHYYESQGMYSFLCSKCGFCGSRDTLWNRRKKELAINYRKTLKKEKAKLARRSSKRLRRY